MRLPALWLAAAFAGGIATSRTTSSASPIWWIATVSAIVAGLLIALFTRYLRVAGALALAAWFALGGLVAQLEHGNVAHDDAATLIVHGVFQDKDPLRWTGRLRDDPEPTPVGLRYIIDLQSVEEAGQLLPVHGGLRLTYYRGANDEIPQPLHAGDTVEALCRARIPRNYLDPGAFDEREYLARQGIELISSLRSAELLRVLSTPMPSLAEHFARVRGTLLSRVDTLFAGKPNRIAVLRAMLLGDRNFVNSDVADAFQRTSAFHVLVLAGLHVAALGFFFFWIGRLLRLPPTFTTVLTLAALAAYLGVVQDRPPILRAAMMTAVFLCARLFFRRVALLNTVALAAILLLAATPSELFDSSFQLSFLAAGVIAGLAVPWIDRTSVPYRQALEHLSDVTRDRLHSPRATQFRLDLRAAANATAKRIPRVIATHATSLFILPIRLGLRLWEVFLLSFCIQLGLAPMLAHYFHRVSISGPASNIFAVLLTSVIVPLGFLTLALSYVSASLGLAAAKIESLFVGWLLTIVKWFSALPRASWRVPGPPPLLLIVFFAVLSCLAALAWSAQRNLNPRIARISSPPPRRAEKFCLLALLLLAFLVAVHPFPPHLAKGKLEATVLDVGQGDSIFVAFPDSRTMLIDGGGASGAEHVGGYQIGFDVGEQVVSPYLWSRGLKKLDVVLLTHAHHDHIDGLRAVLNDFRVRQLWVGRDEDSATYRDLLAEAKARGVAVIHVSQGKDFNWDGVEGQILWPNMAYDVGGPPVPANNDSVVLRIGDGAVHFLLPGDAERQVEDTLTKEQEPLQSDFLKVPHHGSKTSSTEQFLDAVSPRFAVISVGADNSYGHPNSATVQRYVGKHIQLFRTDSDGAVTAITDGRSVRLKTFVSGVTQ